MIKFYGYFVVANMKPIFSICHQYSFIKCHVQRQPIHAPNVNIYIVYYGAIWHKAIVAIKLERPSDNIKNDNVVFTTTSSNILSVH